MQLIMSRKAVGYRRVSGKSQADNFSLRSQDEDIRDYAEHEGLPFDTMFTDVGSGLSTKQRPNFLNMGEYALDRKNSITDVVFHDLDRFTRNIEEFFIYTKDLIKAGITLHLAVDGEKYDYHSEEKWHQRLVAGQAESKRTSRRTKRGQRTATRMGPAHREAAMGLHARARLRRGERQGGTCHVRQAGAGPRTMGPRRETVQHVNRRVHCHADCQVQQTAQCPIAQRRTVDRRIGPVHPEEREIPRPPLPGGKPSVKAARTQGKRRGDSLGKCPSSGGYP